MKIAVIGAGITGVCTAHALATDGHEVVVYDRRSSVAEGASFATGGLCGPGYVEPGTHTISTGLGLSRHELGWLWQRRKQQPKGLERMVALKRLLSLANWSRERQRDLMQRHNITIEQQDGLMLLFRSAQDAALSQPRLDTLRAHGVSVQPVTAALARKLELAMNNDTPLHSAAYLPGDSAGNCRQFAVALKGMATTMGVRFELASDVAPLQQQAPTCLTVTTPTTPQTPALHDAVVICNGAAAAPLLEPLGLQVPVAKVRGHAISAQVREPLNTPHSAVWDATHRVSITRIGHRLRVAGGAELGTGDAHAGCRGVQTLYRVLHDWFPGAAKIDQSVQIWHGEQATTLDGLPMLGPSHVPGVWLNVGHGSNGWALANGCAEVLADLIAGRTPPVDVAPFSPGRWS